VVVGVERVPESIQFDTDEELAAGLDRDGRINLEFTLKEDGFNKIIKDMDDRSKKQIEELRAKGMRPEDIYTKESQLDSITWSTTTGPGTITLQAAETREGLDSAPAVEAHMESMKIQQRVRGVFWPAEEHTFIVFSMPDGSLLKFDLFNEPFTKEERFRFITALVKRNHRLKAPLFWHPCPECGTYFKPERRGQLYNSRKCADRAGQRRRYKSRI
jgi:hypothetical protein